MHAYIGGTVPMSTIDWPKNICTVIFFAGCDFKCPYCQNPNLIDFREELQKDLREVKEEIKKNKSFIDAVLFSGGEACLQRSAVVELASYAKSLGLKVGIETNGSKPEVLMTLMKSDLLDFVGLDIKCPMQPDMFNKVTRSGTFFKNPETVIDNVARSLRLLSKSRNNIDFEIRTTIVPGLIYKVEDLQDIAKSIQDIECTWVLQQFRSDFGNILDPILINIKPPTKAYIENLRREILKEHPRMHIEIKAI